MTEPWTCPRCGVGKKRYKGQSYCVDCHHATNVAARRKPGRYKRVKAANNAWQRANPESNRAAQQRWRDKQRAEREPWPPAEYMLVAELRQILSLSRHRVAQLIDCGVLLGCYKDKGQWLIPRAAVADYLRPRERVVGESSP